MAAVGAYECPICGGLKFTAEGSTNPMFMPGGSFEHYGRPHVCNPKAIAEKRYMSDPRLTYEEVFGPIEGGTE